jgi:hypothetical protein
MQKKNVLTVQSVQMLTWQRLYDDMACLYAEVAVDDVAISYWQMWANHWWTRGIFLVKWFGATWPSHGLPRGTLLLVWFFQNIMESVGIEPQTSPTVAKSWQRLPNRCATT